MKSHHGWRQCTHHTADTDGFAFPLEFAAHLESFTWNLQQHLKAWMASIPHSGWHSSICGRLRLCNRWEGPRQAICYPYGTLSPKEYPIKCPETAVQVDRTHCHRERHRRPGDETGTGQGRSHNLIPIHWNDEIALLCQSEFDNITLEAEHSGSSPFCLIENAG